MKIKSFVAGYSIFASVVVAAFAYVSIEMSDWNPPWGTPEPLAVTIADDMRNNPKGWVATSHHMFNDRWVLWTPSGPHFLTVCANDVPTDPNPACYSGDAEFTLKSRKHIWDAVREVRKKADQQRMEALVARTT